MRYKRACLDPRGRRVVSDSIATKCTSVGSVPICWRTSRVVGVLVAASYQPVPTTSKVCYGRKIYTVPGYDGSDCASGGSRGRRPVRKACVECRQAVSTVRLAPLPLVGRSVDDGRV